MLGLKVRTGALEVIQKRLLRRGLFRGESLQHFGSGDKHIRQCFIAMHVEKQIASGLVHATAHAQHLGTMLR